MRLGKSQRDRDPTHIASVAVFDEKGKLLFGRRNDNQKFTLPGGHMEPGEEPRAAARRELKEETGIDVPESRFRHLGDGQAGAYLIHCYQVEMNRSDFKHGDNAPGPHGKDDPDDECSEWRYVDVDDGLPEEIASNLHSKKNVTLRLIGLQRRGKDEAPPKLPETDDEFLFKTEDEVARLMQNPDPRERRMALKLDGVRREHLAAAFAHPDPVVQHAALDHPGSDDPEVLTSLMRLPGRLRLQHEAMGRDSIEPHHLLDLYRTAAAQEDPLARGVISSIASHPKLEEPLWREMWDDPRHGSRRALINHPVAPGDALEGVVLNALDRPEMALGGSLARDAARHPSLTPAGREAAVKRSQGPLRESVASNPELEDRHITDILASGRIPRTFDPEAQARQNVLQGRHVTAEHLSMALEDHHPQVRAAVFRSPSPALGPQHVRRAFERGEPDLIQAALASRPVRQQRGSSAASCCPARRRPTLATMAKAEPGVGGTGYSPHPRVMQEAADYMQQAGFPYQPMDRLHPVDPEFQRRTSAAYEAIEHRPHDPQVKAAYDALKQETMAQYQHLKGHGYRFTPASDFSAAGTEADAFDTMHRDVGQNKHLHVFTGGDLPHDHPLAEPSGDPDLPSYNDVFRAVHDVYGHVKPGVDFGHDGEERAWHSHASMYSPLARRALATETRGQNTNYHYGTNGEHNRANPAQAIFPPQKAGLMPEEFSHTPTVHPSMAKTESPLIKMAHPDHFQALLKASDQAGRDLVDHRGHLEGHPAMHQHFVDNYRRLLDSPAAAKRLAQPKGSNISRKVILAAPEEAEGTRYMVKPYHERITRAVSKWMKHPHQGWAEMATQALYHAGKIGHLHQAVHVAEHNMGPGFENEPALVIKMAPGFENAEKHVRFSHTAAGAGCLPGATDQSKSDARRIGMMDFLTNNLDRHGSNLLWNPTSKQVLSIDTPRSFQYVRSGDHYKHRDSLEADTDNMDGYLHRGAVGDVLGADLSNLDKRRAHADSFEPETEWWWDHKEPIRAAMRDQLQHLRDPAVREHIANNFEHRARHFDQMADFGIHNFGDDWYNSPIEMTPPRRRGR